MGTAKRKLLFDKSVQDVCPAAPAVKKNRLWDNLDEHKLIQAVNTYGEGEWVKIKKLYNFTNYTNNQIRYKWRQLKSSGRIMYNEENKQFLLKPINYEVVLSSPKNNTKSKTGRTKWTKEEENKLRKGVDHFGAG